MKPVNKLQGCDLSEARKEEEEHTTEYQMILYHLLFSQWALFWPCHKDLLPQNLWFARQALLLTVSLWDAHVSTSRQMVLDVKVVPSTLVLLLTTLSPSNGEAQQQTQEEHLIRSGKSFSSDNKGWEHCYNPNK